MKRTNNKGCPNPLFEKWLTELYEQAKADNKDVQYCFKKALGSLKKYPLVLQSGKECIILEHFGSKLCQLLDKKLSEYKESNNIIDLCEANDYNNENKKIKRNNSFERKKTRKEIVDAHQDIKCLELYNDEDDNNANKATIKKSEENEQPLTTKITDKQSKNVPQKEIELLDSYAPRKGSKPYAFLMGLYKKSKDPNYVGYMTKDTLIMEAEKYFECSNKQEDRELESKFSCISPLIQKGLIAKSHLPARYALTKKGLDIMEKMFENEISSEETNVLNYSYCKEYQDPHPLVAKSPTSNLYTKILTDTDKEVLSANILQMESTSLKCVEPINVEINEGEPINVDTISSTNSKHVNFERETNKRILNLRNPKSKENVSKTAQSVQTIDTTDSICLQPGTFDIILLVDIHETNSKSKPELDTGLVELTSSKTPFEIRHLNVGDFTWIARCRQNNNELVLPYIVERKRVDDLSSSIKDGRFHEQKFRLKQSGLKNIIYLVENLNIQTSIPIKSLLQASVNSVVQDGFTLKFTNSHKDSMKYLSILTTTITKQYEKRCLLQCKKSDLELVNNLHDSQWLMNFAEFNKASAKVKNLKVKEVFIRQLLQMKGISVEKAMAIVERYPTPSILRKSFKKSGENLLADIKVGPLQRQIGSVISKTIYRLYTHDILQ